MARALLKMATDEDTPEHVKLKAITEALDRAGVNAKTSVEVAVSAKPYEQMLEGMAQQLEITSRSAYRRSMGTDDNTDDESDPLADLTAQDEARAQAAAQRDVDIARRIRANHYQDDSGILDVSVVDVNDDDQPITPGDPGRRPGGQAPRDDQPMTLPDAAERVAEIRRAAVIRPARRALPPGRSTR